MLTRPDITRPKPRPRPEGPRPRPNHRGRGRKVYRYGRVNDSCNYVTYVGYVIKKCQQNRATYKTVVTTTVIVKVPCSSDHIQRAKLHFKNTRLWLSNRMNDRSSPRPNIMQVVNESVYLKTSFSGRWASALASFRSRPRPHAGSRGRSHLLQAEAAKNWPRGLTSLIGGVQAFASTRPRYNHGLKVQPCYVSRNLLRIANRLITVTYTCIIYTFL